MAILKKRTSSKTIPEARGLDRAPLNSIIQGVNQSPSISGGSSSLTSTGSGSRPSITTPTGSSKPTLTSTTGSKPAVTTTTPKTPTSITTSPSTVPKQTVKPKTTNTNSTTSKVVNALTGAAIGAGTKLLIDKISSKPDLSKTTAQKAAEKKALDAAVSKDKAAAATVAAAAKASADAATRARAEADAKAKAEAAKPKAPPTSVVKPPVTDPKDPNYVGPPAPPAGDEFITDEKGNVYQVMPDGSEVLYRAAEVPEDEFTTDSLGNIYKTMPDGTSELYRAAEVPEDEFTTDSLGNIYKTMPDGTSELYRAAEVSEDEYMTDSLGNVYKTMPDGTYELYLSAKDTNETTTPTDGGTRSMAGTGGTNAPVENGNIEYYQDEFGNIYTQGEDGSYTLFSEAGGDTGNAFLETPSEPEYFQDSLGNVYTQGESGEYELYRVAEVPEDIAEEDYNFFNPDYSNVDYSIYADNDYNVNNDSSSYYTTYDDEEYVKRGGLITMMKQGGGIKGYADGGVTQTYDDGSYTIFFDDGSTMSYDENGDYYGSSPATDGPVTTSTRTLGSEWPSGYVSNGDGTATTVFDDGSTMTVDEDMNPVHSTNSTEVTGAGGGSRNWYDDYLKPVLSGGQRLASDALSGITGALGTTAGAAGAGALVATLLGQDFGGGTGNQNEGLDMSKVGVINPRTTDFGIGPTQFVGYEDYGTGGGGYTPNEELLRNLNAPGFNPVNEGDYGYEAVPAKEEAPKMASGGLSSMATPVASYYTFGQPADILANLGMRAQPPMNPPEMMPQIGQQQPPQQAQQQGLPQQMPPQMGQQMPQGMPQQGMMPQQQGMPPPMRKGGLPHVSDVPMTEGRMDFRRGSAVHGAGDGQSDDIPAMLADGEYVIDAETVAQIGNGSTKAGAQALDKFREGIRAHKRSAPINKIPPKTKALTSYLKGAK